MPVKPPRPHNRAGIWYLVKKVPQAFAHLDKRGLVRVSTEIAVVDDPRGVRAKLAVARLAVELEAYWRGLRDGQGMEAQRRYEEARKRARSHGLGYLPAAELAESTIDEIVSRFRVLVAQGQQAPEVEEQTFAAVLGGEPVPEVRLATIVDEYQSIMSTSLLAYSEDQKRRWRNPKVRAANNLREVIGDKAIAEITRSDAIDFRNWLQKRVAVDGIDIGTANKDIGHLNKMMRTIDMHRQLGLQPVFGHLRIEGEETGRRTAFAPAFVQDTILANGALARLNEEARRVVYLVAETGLRLSEAVNLTADTIHLDAPVPYVSVRPDGRKMKTTDSERDIPLVGVALEAMRKQPNGFPRYRDKSASLSALVNKFMDNAKMRPTPGHSLYSLRHTFEDRLTAVEVPEKLMAALMGHKFHRPKYGAGPSLEQKREWMLKVAFQAPLSI